MWIQSDANITVFFYLLSFKEHENQSGVQSWVLLLKDWMWAASDDFDGEPTTDGAVSDLSFQILHWSGRGALLNIQLAQQHR